MLYNLINIDRRTFKKMFRNLFLLFTLITTLSGQISAEQIIFKCKYEDPTNPILKYANDTLIVNTSNRSITLNADVFDYTSEVIEWGDRFISFILKDQMGVSLSVFDRETSRLATKGIGFKDFDGPQRLTGHPGAYVEFLSCVKNAF